MISSSGAPLVDLFGSLPRLARFTTLGERIDAAADALSNDGWPDVQILLFGRRAAATMAKIGDLPFAFEPELASRSRKLLYAALAPFARGGLYHLTPGDFDQIAAFGRPPTSATRGLIVIPLGNGERNFGLLVLADDGVAPDEGDGVALRLWADIFATMLESDLQVALYEELELIMRALRSEHEVPSVLGVVTDALAHEFGGVCVAWRWDLGSWTQLAASPLGGRIDGLDLSGLEFDHLVSIELETSIIFPLLVEDRPWGAIGIAETGIRGERRSFAQTVVAHGELALVNALALARHRESTLESTALAEAGRTLLGFTRVEPLARAMSSLAAEFGDAELSAVYLAADDGASFTCIGTYPVVGPNIPGIGTAELTECLHEARSVFFDDGRVIILPLTELPAAGMATEAGACLAISRPAQAPFFTMDALRILEAFTALCALALRNVRLYEASARANRALEESNAFKDDLMAMFAHDFKGPLTVISGYGELVLDQLAGEERESVGIILSQVKRLATLTDDALSLARAQAQGFTLQREPGELIAFVQDVIKTCSGPHCERLILETRETEIHLYFDPLAMRHVLDNILGNALKYSTELVHIELLVERNEAAIVVRDAGIGIPAHELANVFGRFARASNARRRGIHGSGVGLYIAKVLTEQHGGRIFASSCEGEGSTFEIRLPRR